MGSWSNKAVMLEPIEFDGDQIVFSVQRLRIDDMQTLMKHYDEKMGAISVADPLELCKLSNEILPKYITGMTGMVSADNTPVTLEEFKAVMSEFYFAPMLAIVLARLIAISTVRGVEKNFAPPSPV